VSVLPANSQVLQVFPPCRHFAVNGATFELELHRDPIRGSSISPSRTTHRAAENRRSKLFTAIAKYCQSHCIVSIKRQPNALTKKSEDRGSCRLVAGVA